MTVEIQPFNEDYIGCYCDLEKANNAVTMVESLKYMEGTVAGQNIKLMQYEVHMIKAIFGTMRPNGKRLIKNVFYSVARKNAKSTISSAILFLVLVTGGQGTQVVSVANDKNQSAIIYHMMEGILQQDKHLAKKFKFYTSTKQIKYPKTNSIYKAMASQVASLHGWNIAGAVFDEIGEFTDRTLVDVITTSQVVQEQPLNLYISTAGYDKNTVFYELYEYAKKVMSGEISDMTFLPYLFEVPEDADWTDESLYHLANPKVEIIPKLSQYLKEERLKAMRLPSYESNFRRLHLNQWVDSETVWLQMAKWKALADPDFDESQLLGRDCYAGLDLSNRIDLTAFVMIFPLDDGRLYIKPMFFLPEEGLRDKANNDKVPYHMWAKQGYIDLTPDVSIDFRRVEDYIYRCNQMYNILEVGYDRWKSNMLVQNLVDKGVAMVEVSQSFQGLSEAIKEVEVRVLNGNFLHNKNPVMDWNISNCTIIMDDNENVKITKKNKRNKRVDGAVALVMAVKRLMHYESNFYSEDYVAPLMYGDNEDE